MKVYVSPPEADGTVSYWLFCPACNDAHRITNRWQVDLTDPEAPTVTPSILVQGRDLEGPTVCHSWLRAGVWEFLGDSTHLLAGQRVPMVDLPDWMQP